MNSEDKRSTDDGLDTVKDIAGDELKAGVKFLVKHGKEIAGAVKQAGEEAGKYLAETLASSEISLSLVLVVILIILIIILLICCCFPIQTLFTKQRISTKTVEECLRDGFNKTKEEAHDRINSYIATNHPLATGGDAVFKHDHFIYETEQSTITIDFSPELSEFAMKIDAYAQSVNSTLAFFNQTDEEENDTPIEHSVSYLNEKGEIELTDYGKDLLKSVDSEYTNSMSDKYKDTLRHYAKSIFSTGSEQLWSDKTFVGQKMKKERHCEKLSSLTDEYEPIACTLFVEDDYRYRDYKVDVPVPAILGTITIPMSYDPTLYKKEAMEGLCNYLVGKEMAVPKDYEGKEFEVKRIESYQEACSYVERIRSAYEMSYLSAFTDLEYGYGYCGQLSKMPTFTSADDFWNKYGRGSEFWKITHPNGSLGPGEKQCTLFVSVISYMNYGVHTGPNDGVNSAKYVASTYPDIYVLSTTPAPGAIVSLTPNHVLIVDEVTPEGGVYISEGNYDGMGSIRIHVFYNSLSDYEKSRGMTVKDIAIPRKN